jgi:hypothetical protein
LFAFIRSVRLAFHRLWRKAPQSIVIAVKLIADPAANSIAAKRFISQGSVELLACAMLIGVVDTGSCWGSLAVGGIC